MVRKLPVVLPHNIVGNRFWPRIPDEDIKHYWSHLRAVGSPLAGVSPQGNHIPLWIWGDGAQWRENGDEIYLICIGCCIDKRKFSVESCYPISLCKSDSWFLVRKTHKLWGTCSQKTPLNNSLNYLFVQHIMFFPKNLSDQEIFAGFLTLHDILTAAPWVHLVCSETLIHPPTHPNPTWPMPVPSSIG